MAWVRETPGGGWRGLYRDPSGKIRSRSFGRNEKGKARKWAADQEASIRGGNYVEPKSGSVTVAQLFEEVHAARPYAPATLALHAHCWGDPEDPQHALYGLRHRKAGYVSRKDVDDALAKIASSAVRDKTRLLLSTLFNHAMDHHQLRENPARKLRATGTRAEKMAASRAGDHRKRYLTDDELTRLRDAVPDRYATLVHLMGRVGLRPGEALALSVGKFDPMRRRLTIDTSVSGFTKTGEARVVALPAVIAEELAEHLARVSDPADSTALMFPSGEGRMLTVGGFRHIFQRAVARAGLDQGLTPNDLRHSAVSWAINLGANVYAVQRMVGHAKPSITLDVYGELWSEDANKLAEKMDDALRAVSPNPSDAGVVAIG